MAANVLRTEIDLRVKEARSAVRAGVVEQAWPLLEQAHVLSQPLARPQINVHWVMLRTAVTTRDPRECAGQLIRLALAGPGSLLGRYPAGNSGRARVSAFASSRVSDDLQAILDRASGDSGGGA